MTDKQRTNEGQTKDKQRTPADTRRTYEGHTKDSQGTEDSFIQGLANGHLRTYLRTHCGHTKDTKDILRTLRTYCGHTEDTCPLVLSAGVRRVSAGVRRFFEKNWGHLRPCPWVPGLL